MDGDRSLAALRRHRKSFMTAPGCPMPRCAMLCTLCRAVCQVEHKSIPGIARELAHLQQLAAAGKLSSLDVTGGSITISNIGKGVLWVAHRCVLGGWFTTSDTRCHIALSPSAVLVVVHFVP